MVTIACAQPSNLLLRDLPSVLKQIADVRAILAQYTSDEHIATTLQQEPKILFNDCVQLKHHITHLLHPYFTPRYNVPRRFLDSYKQIRNKKQWHEVK